MTAILICLSVILVLQLLTPFWWWVMIVPFVFGASSARSGWAAFRTGFAAAGLLWLGAAGFHYLFGSRIIAGRMAEMIGLGKAGFMMAATALVAAGAAGAAALAGYAVRTLFRRERSD
ncbi:MAG: hypothetical protein SCM96_00340 [Acidobacteriota bacterium]|nr:hypothetical protein [Acidobacteriota bacterium]